MGSAALPHFFSFRILLEYTVYMCKQYEYMITTEYMIQACLFCILFVHM